MKDHWSPLTGPRHKDQQNTALSRKERRDNMAPVKVVSPETEEKYDHKALEMPFRWENTDGSTRINLDWELDNNIDATTKSKDKVIDNEASITKENEKRKYEMQPEIITHWKETMIYVEEDTCLGYKQHIRRLISNHFRLVQTIGKALGTVILLRRCLYPKRDVIRWMLMRRIHNTVREGALYLWNLYDISEILKDFVFRFVGPQSRLNQRWVNPKNWGLIFL